MQSATVPKAPPPGLQGAFRQTWPQIDRPALPVRCQQRQQPHDSARTERPVCWATRSTSRSATVSQPGTQHKPAGRPRSGDAMNNVIAPSIPEVLPAARTSWLNLCAFAAHASRLESQTLRNWNGKIVHDARHRRNGRLGLHGTCIGSTGSRSARYSKRRKGALRNCATASIPRDRWLRRCHPKRPEPSPRQCHEPSPP